MATQKKPFVRSMYNYDTNKASDDSALVCDPEDDFAVQSEKADADINTLVRRFGVTGVMPQGVRVPSYGDFDGPVHDYHTAMNAIRKADESFNEMPPEIRERFDNDPGKFVDFCSDPDNLEEMRKLGLAVPEVVKPEVYDDERGIGGHAEAPSEAAASRAGSDGKGAGGSPESRPSGQSGGAGAAPGQPRPAAGRPQ